MQILLVGLLVRLGKMPAQETQIPWQLRDFARQAPAVAVVVEPLMQQQAMEEREDFPLLEAVEVVLVALREVHLARGALVPLVSQLSQPISKCPSSPNFYQPSATSSVARSAVLPWRLSVRLLA